MTSDAVSGSSPGPDMASGHLLGFDFGKRRIGVAVGQTQTGTASALDTIANGGQPDWAHIDRLVAEWKPALLVVGLPLAENGTETPMSRLAREFGSRLRKRFDLHVDYFDERLTSRDASRRFADLRAAGSARRRDAGRIDAMAARIILENWLQSHGG